MRGIHANGHHLSLIVRRRSHNGEVNATTSLLWRGWGGGGQWGTGVADGSHRTSCDWTKTIRGVVQLLQS